MRIEVKDLMIHKSKRYPYTHRVDVREDAFASEKISAWLDDNKIPYTRVGWNNFYLTKEGAAWLLLRWA